MISQLAMVDLYFILHSKMKVLSLFTLFFMLFQTCITEFLLWNTKEDILKNVTGVLLLFLFVPTMKVSNLISLSLQ